MILSSCIQAGPLQWALLPHSMPWSRFTASSRHCHSQGPCCLRQMLAFSPGISLCSACRRYQSAAATLTCLPLSLRASHVAHGKHAEDTADKQNKTGPLRYIPMEAGYLSYFTGCNNACAGYIRCNCLELSRQAACTSSPGAGCSPAGSRLSCHQRIRGTHRCREPIPVWVPKEESSSPE